MKFVKLSQTEYEEIRKLYEGVMSQACYGLFFREGMILGEDIAKIAMQEPALVETRQGDIVALMRTANAGDHLYMTRSADDGVTWAPPSDIPTCHRLRGIVRKVYETRGHRRLHCEEIECMGRGDKHCVFKIESIGGE